MQQKFILKSGKIYFHTFQNKIAIALEMTTATITSYDILDVYDYFDKGDDLVMVMAQSL